MKDRLIGRRRELAALRAALARTPGGFVVALTGEPGIGKTRLLESLSDLATAQEMFVCSGRAIEAERGLAYSIFAAALDAPFTGRCGRKHAESVSAVRREIRRTACETTTPRDAMAALPHPVCLLLDNAHWADPASLRFLEDLLRTPPPGVLIALGYRPRQTPADLHDAVRRTVAAGHGVRLELGPLTPDDVAAMTEGALRAANGGSVGACEDANRLHRSSGGNPFYVEVLMQMGAAGHVAGVGSVEPDEEPGELDDELPAAVQFALVGELAALPELDRQVLQAAAVAGETFDVELVAAVAALEVPETRAALDRLAARELIRKPPYRHRHPLMRRAAYTSAWPAWRLMAHARAAGVLAVRGATAVARAHHVERVAVPGDDTAVTVLTAAATESLATSPESAARWLGVALNLLPDRPASLRRRLELKIWRAGLLGTIGRLYESRSLLHDALHALPPDKGELRALAVGFCAMVERLLGRHAEARALLNVELAVLPEGDHASFVGLQLELAASRIMAGDWTRDPVWAAQVIPAARGIGDGALLASVLGAGAFGDYVGGVIGLSTSAYVNEAVDLVDSLSDDQLIRRLDALVWVAWAETYGDRLIDAQRHLSRALRLARASGQIHLLTYVLYLLGTVCTLRGMLDEATAYSADLAEVAERTGSDEIRIMALTQQSWVLAWRGDLSAAQGCVEEATALAARREGWMSSLVGGTLARVQWFAGDPSACVKMLWSAGHGPDLPAFDPLTRVSWLALLAEAEAERGRFAAADAAAAAAADIAKRSGLPLTNGLARLARAHALLGRSPADSAHEALAAAESLEESGHRVTEGRARLTAAIASARAGDQHRTHEQFDLAERLFAPCNARIFLDQINRERRRLAPEPTVLASILTEREKEIARLVTHGHTNREIAAALFVSLRTVEGHMTRMFGKLGVSSRASLAALLADIASIR